MIKALRESKTKLSNLIRLANQDEGILVTIRGKVKAKLTGVETQDKADDMRAWVLELENLQRTYSTGRSKLSVEDILTEDRQEHL